MSQNDDDFPTIPTPRRMTCERSDGTDIVYVVQALFGKEVAAVFKLSASLMADFSHNVWREERIFGPINSTHMLSNEPPSGPEYTPTVNEWVGMLLGSIQLKSSDDANARSQ